MLHLLVHTFSAKMSVRLTLGQNSSVFPATVFNLFCITASHLPHPLLCEGRGGTSVILSSDITAFQ